MGTPDMDWRILGSSGLFHFNLLNLTTKNYDILFLAQLKKVKSTAMNARQNRSVIANL